MRKHPPPPPVLCTLILGCKVAKKPQHNGSTPTPTSIKFCMNFPPLVPIGSAWDMRSFLTQGRVGFFNALPPTQRIMCHKSEPQLVPHYKSYTTKATLPNPRITLPVLQSTRAFQRCHHPHPPFTLALATSSHVLGGANLHDSICQDPRRYR